MIIIARVFLHFILICAVCGLVGNEILNILKTNKARRKFKIIAICSAFLIYFAFLAIVLFTASLRRLPEIQDGNFLEYIMETTNFKPFKTIKLFVRGYNNGVVSLSVLLSNIVGNIVLFVPMGFLLLSVFKIQRNFICFFITAFWIIASVECLQMLLCVGYADIDDFILNMSGFIIAYIVWYLREIMINVKNKKINPVKGL